MPLNANFLADFSSFVDACRDATTSTDQLVEAAGKVGADVDQMIAKSADSMKTIATGVVDFAKSAYSVLSSDQVKNFVGDVKAAATEYINEFAEAEAATTRLTVALDAQEKVTPGVTKAYLDLAAQLQSVSRFSDEALMDAMSLFTSIGQVGPDAMEQTMRATMELAVAMKKDVPEAAQILLKAAQSDGEELGKLKKIMGDSIPVGASFAEIIKAVGDHFAGNVAADLQTTAGATLNLKNQMSDFNEIIGGALADNLKSIMAVFKALPEGMQTFIVAVVSIGTAIAPLAVSLASVVSLFGAAGLGAALAAAGAAIVPFLPLIAAIGAAVLAVWAVWHYWDDIVAVVKKAVDYMKIYLGDVLPAVFKSVIQSVMDVYNGIKLWLWDKLSALVDSVVKLPGKITAAFGAMYDAVVGHSYVPDLMNSIGRHFGRLDYIMVNPALAAVQNVVGIFSALSDPIKIGQASITGGGAPWGGAAGAGGGTTVNVTVNMSGMLGTDDPQTRSMISSLVSDAVMQGMRNTRLLGTA